MNSCTFRIFLSILTISCSFDLVNTDDSNTTTLAPTTSTTTTASTSTASPVPPTPTVPVYSVSNGTDICLLIQANIQLSITYFNKSGQPVVQNMFLNSSSKIQVNTNGSCSNKTNTVQLQWWPSTNEVVVPSLELGLRFNKHDDNNFGLDFMDFNYTLTEAWFPGTNETIQHFVWRNESAFKCAIGSYFQCMTAQSFLLSKAGFAPPPIVQPDVTLTLSDLKVEAFRSGNKETFVGTVRECSADYVPNKVVPIVVGICLAAMIIIALITFVIASRRRQMGYQEIS